MKPKDDLGHEESRDFSGFGVVDGLGAIEGFTDTKADQ
jgi:hypothetical protein